MRWNTINSRDDEDFRALLTKWDAPQISSELDERIMASFRCLSQKEDVLPDHVSLIQTEVITMKQCPNCKETFSTMFVFCPIDSTLLVDEAEVNKEPQFDFIVSENETIALASTGAYHVTMMNDAGLVSRLIAETKATAKQIRLAVPAFKEDPVGFLKETTSNFSQAAFRFVTSPNVAVSFVIALVFMISTVVGIAVLDRYRSTMLAKDNVRDDLELRGIIDIPKVEEQKEGNAGTAKGNGGGSGEKDKPHGGGGGGREEEKPPSYGKSPMAVDNPPLKTPEAVPPPLPKDALVVKPTIQGDSVILPEDTRPIPYGVDDSTSLDPSNGRGKGDGQGDGNGAGNGNGDGNGKGPGEKENTGGGKPERGKDGPGGGGNNVDVYKTYRKDEVTQKARITFNPQPQYTEEARKNSVQGVVRLALVLTASGQVQSIRVTSSLPDGLTDKAIEAARRIKFIPAQKDGRYVSQYVTVEYNFRIY